MSDSVDILKKLALQVRNASTEGENTAERIGRIFIGILENMDNSDLEKAHQILFAQRQGGFYKFSFIIIGRNCH